MRKSFCLVVVCILVLAFGSVTDVSAIGKNKIVRTQWSGEGMMKIYSPTGDFVGAATGEGGIMFINETSGGEIELMGYYAVSFDTTTPEVVVVGSRGEMMISQVTYKKNQLKGTFCSIVVYDPEGTPVFGYEGECDAKIKFRSAKAFIGAATFTDTEGTGLTAVIELSGTLLGQTPPVE